MHTYKHNTLYGDIKHRACPMTTFTLRAFRLFRPLGIAARAISTEEGCFTTDGATPLTLAQCNKDKGTGCGTDGQCGHCRGLHLGVHIDNELDCVKNHAQDVLGVCGSQCYHLCCFILGQQAVGSRCQQT